MYPAKMNSVIEADTSKMSEASAILPVAKRLRYVRSKEDVKALLRWATLRSSASKGMKKRWRYNTNLSS
jgi:hypothetical protein